MGVRVPGLLLLVLPVVIAGVVLMVVTATDKRQKAFGRQGVAWFITSLMIVAAIGIGYGKAHASNAAEPAPDLQPGSSPALETVPPNLQQGATAPNAAAAGYFERDDAGVLSDDTMTRLNARNQRLYERFGVVIGVITCNYGRADLVDYAYKVAEQMDLREYDMLVVLDVRGGECGMIQGAGLVDDFTDGDCDRYARDYMMDAFSAGDYDRAVLDLTEMLELWYGIYFG